MDPIQSAENKNMPTKASPTVDLTESQRDALFGPGGCVPGEMYELKLKAGELGDAGSQTFEIVETESEYEEAPAEDMAAEEDSSPDDEVSMLGYDRKKMVSKRGKQSAKLDMKDLEY